MDTADVMASKAHIDALAMKLRAGGLPGPLGTLRVLALADLTQGRDPLDRLTPRDSAPPEPADAPVPDPDGWPGWGGGGDGPEDIDGDDSADAPADSARPGDPPSAPGRVPRPMPALINLNVPAGTLLGWSSRPGPGRRLGPARRRRDAHRGQRRGQPPAHPLVRHPHCPRGHRASPRLRPRPASPAAQRPGTAAAARPARRTSPPSQPHLHPHRQRRLRPRPSRGPVRPEP